MSWWVSVEHSVQEDQEFEAILGDMLSLCLQINKKGVWKWVLRVSRSVTKGLPNVFEALSSISKLFYYIDKANIGCQDVTTCFLIVTVFPVVRTLPSPLEDHYWTLGTF